MEAIVTVFDGYIVFGRRVMIGANRNERPSIRYKRLLGLITELLRDTHALVVEKLEAIESADSWSEAQQLAQELRDEPLTDSFRAQGLCDAFAGLGQALDGLNEYTSVESPGAFSAEDTSTAATIAQMLADREREVARYYVREIREARRRRIR